MNCESLKGRLRDICRGHDDDGNPIAMSEDRRRAYLERWRKNPPRQTKNRGACRHRGDETRRVECPTCGGRRVELKVFACSIHGECLPTRQLDGLTCCAQCPDHAPPPDTRRRVIIRQDLSPGDAIVLTAAIRALHERHPGQFRTDVRTAAPAIWQHNPHIEPLAEDDAETIRVHYGSDRGPGGRAGWYADIHQCNQHPIHFIEAATEGLGKALDLPEPLRPVSAVPEIFLSDDERRWKSQVQEITGQPSRFWIVNAGRKSDYTAKQWPTEHYQAVVDATPGVCWVQIGADDPGHVHPPLRGAIDLRGRTDFRQLIRLFYHAAGVLTPVSCPMHLAAAVPRHPRFDDFARPCIVLGGGREPQHWNTYPGQHYLHTIGRLDCCRKSSCWKARTVPLRDGSDKDRSLCERPADGFPQCMRSITPADVIRLVKDSPQ